MHTKKTATPAKSRMSTPPPCQLLSVDDRDLPPNERHQTVRLSLQSGAAALVNRKKPKISVAKGLIIEGYTFVLHILMKKKIRTSSVLPSTDQTLTVLSSLAETTEFPIRRKRHRLHVACVARQLAYEAARLHAPQIDGFVRTA